MALWRLLSLVSVAFGAPLTVDYRLTGAEQASISWKDFTQADVILPSEEHFSKENEGSKVVQTLHGNGKALAQEVWDAYQPSPDAATPKLQWRIAYNNSSFSVTSMPMSRVKSEKQLARILSNVEVHLLVDGDSFISGNVRVPWELLEDLDSSSSRLGTVYVARPQPPCLVVEEPPKAKASKAHRNMPDEEEWEPRPQPEPSFWRKYWWIFLVGYFLINTFLAQPEQPEAAAAGAAPAASESARPVAKSKAENKRH